MWVLLGLSWRFCEGLVGIVRGGGCWVCHEGFFGWFCQDGFVGLCHGGFVGLCHGGFVGCVMMV